MKKLLIQAIVAPALIVVPAIALAPSSAFNALSVVTATVAGQVSAAKLALTGVGSTGDVSEMSVAFPSLATRTLLDRLRERPSVVDYGVDMTGVSDSTAAFARALNSGQRLTAPCGTIRLVSSVNVTATANFSGSGDCTVLKFDAPAGVPVTPLMDVRASAVGSKFSDVAFDHQNNTKHYSDPTVYNRNLIAGSMVLIQADNTSFDRVAGRNGHDNCFAVVQLNPANPTSANPGRPLGVSLRNIRSFGCGTNAYKSGAGIDVASGGATVVDNLVDNGSSGAFILDIGAGAQGTFSNLIGLNTAFDATLFARNGTRSQTFYIGASGSTFTNLVSQDAGDRGMWLDYFTDRNTYVNVQLKGMRSEALLWKARASTMTNLYIESPGLHQDVASKDGVVFDTTGGPIDAAHLVGVSFGNEANAARYAFNRVGTGDLRGYIIGADTARATVATHNLPANFGLVDGRDLGGGWTVYTPVVACDGTGNGTLNASSASGSYRQVGRTVEWQANATVTDKGTCTSTVRLTLPTVSSDRMAFLGMETALSGTLIGGATYGGVNYMSIKRADGSTTATDGYVLTIGGTYRAP